MPNGFCECGCGGKTKIIEGTDSRRGWVKGQSMRYLLGHSRRTSGIDYVVDAVTGCWLWQLKLSTTGYGRKEGTYAHIYYYKLKYGPVPDGKELDHLCRNRACINPDHVEPVSHTINTIRGARTKYNEEIVKEVRRLHTTGLGYRKLAKLLDMPRSTIGFIIRRDIWKHV